MIYYWILKIVALLENNVIAWVPSFDNIVEFLISSFILGTE